ncbi:MAG: 3'-5' exonuclease, partial [Thermonemataceae bacterium]|nr:3'-5' exonuclease [Thermonemataceae bacterium]
KERFFLIQSTLQEFYKLALTAEIHSVVEETKLKNNVLYISEINEKIAQIIQNEPIPFIYERLGEKYNHLLIDEFQDTSVLQWHNLLPLIENNLANGHFNLIVGDAKQAIYRWRGGEMEQIVHLAYARDEQIGDESIQRLQEMAKAYFYHNEDEAQENLASRYELIQTYIEKKNLATNYRSDAKIITFNNHFFAKIVDKISVEHPFAEKIYDGFKQEIPEKASNKGVVEIRLLEKEADKSYDLLMQEEILTIVKRSLERGFSAKDIAILFRTGDKARKIATLLKEKGFQIVSADSLVLAAEPKVNFLIAMLKTIDNPDNKLAKSEALYLLHTAILEEIPLQEQSDAIRQAVYSKNASNAAFVSYIQEKGYDISWNYLQSLGLYDLLTELIFIFKVVEKHPKNLEFVFKLQDWAMEFSRTKSNHINDFIIEWNKKKDSIAVEMPEADAITITTIHKSKGLEYPIVILPYADWGTKAKYYESIWVDSEGLDFPIQQPEQLPSHLLIRMKDNPAEKIKKFQDKNNEKSILENLNLLYVAFTRAVDGLYILSRKSGKENTITRWITLFVQNLDAEMSPDFQEDNKRYHFGFEENFSRTQSNEEEACIFHLENLALQSVQKKLL